MRWRFTRCMIRRIQGDIDGKCDRRTGSGGPVGVRMSRLLANCVSVSLSVFLEIAPDPL